MSAPLRLATQAQDPPDEPPINPKQAGRIAGLICQYTPTDVCITYRPFDLPDGWVYVQLVPHRGHGLAFGIDPEGRASS